MRAALAALAVATLAACAPEYDWREVRSTHDGWFAMLPGKPVSLTRRISLDSLEVSMSMQGARVGETTFTIAVAELPDDAPATRDRAVAAMRAGMLRNIGAGAATGPASSAGTAAVPGAVGPVAVAPAAPAAVAPAAPAAPVAVAVAPPAPDLRVPVIDAAGARVGEAPGWSLRATGAAQGRPIRMHAAFAARGARAWQWVVLGPEVDEEQARTFVASFRLLQGPR